MSEKGSFIAVGAGPGLGAAAARRFGREGHRVGLIARSPGTLSALAADLRRDGITAATASADITDTSALQAALREVERQVGAAEVVLFSPRPSLDWIKPTLDTGPADIRSAVALSVAGAAATVQAVAPGMRERGHGTLLFTTGGAAVAPHRDRAVSTIAYAAESAYVRLVNETLADDGVYAAQATVVGPIGAGLTHEPDTVAEHLWDLHTGRTQALLVLR
ncbi:SDR family NAD(P)-dependent oxidoreductase [Streptomyces sp. NPDC056844]|uniref:SDR family NAD(P)-dependent oxidoreductase n=1 Tax=unclassified Streptomyces TaxID=2593676 RepID=UPI00367511EA